MAAGAGASKEGGVTGWRESGGPGLTGGVNTACTLAREWAAAGAGAATDEAARAESGVAGKRGDAEGRGTWAGGW